MIQKSFILSCLFASLAFGAAPSAPSVSAPQNTSGSDFGSSGSKKNGILGHSFLVGVQYGFEMSSFSPNNLLSGGFDMDTTNNKVGAVVGYQYTNGGLFEVQVGLGYQMQTETPLKYNGFGLDVNLYGGYHFAFNNWGLAIKTGVGYSAGFLSYSQSQNSSSSSKTDHLISWKLGVDFDIRKIDIGLYFGLPFIYFSDLGGLVSIGIINNSAFLDIQSTSLEYSGSWLRFTLNLQVGYRF